MSENAAIGLGERRPTGKPLPRDRISNNYFDGLEVTGIHKAIFFIIMLAYFFEQLDNWNFGFIAPALQEAWHLQVTDIANIFFWYFIGMTTGGFLGGIVSDFLGRRKTFLGAILIFSLASVLNGLTDDLAVFTAARALTGFGVFCLMVTSQAYIAEIAPAEARGLWQGRIAGGGFIAVPAVALLCRSVIPLGPDAYRIIFYIGGLGLIGFVLGLKYLKESPRWLVAKSRLAEAEEVMEFITHRKVRLVEAAGRVSSRLSLADVLIGMFTERYIVKTLLLILLYITITPANFTLTTWTTQLLKMKGFTVEDSLAASTVISFGVPLGCFLASLVSDLGGRKLPLVYLSAICSALAFGFARQDAYFLLVACGFLLNVFLMALGFVLFSYTAESYPTKLRNTATGFHNGLARLSVSAAQPIIPIIHAAAGFSGVFNAVGLLFVVPIIPVLLWGLRTAGKPLEEIE